MSKLLAELEALASRELTGSQRAVETVLLLDNTKRTEAIPTLKKASEIVGVHKDYLTRARGVMARATPEQVASIRRGEASISGVDEFLKGKRTIHRSEDLERQRQANVAMRSAVWQGLRAALISLTDLPSVKDVAAIVRSKEDRSRIVETRLLPALDFLKEFADVWTSPEEADPAKAGNRNGENPADAGIGDDAARTQQAEPPPQR